MGALCQQICCMFTFYMHSPFTLRKRHSPLRINEERGFLRVNRLCALATKADELRFWWWKYQQRVASLPPLGGMYRAWNSPCYFRILRHPSGAKCGNNMENSKLCMYSYWHQEQVEDGTSSVVWFPHQCWHSCWSAQSKQAINMPESAGVEQAVLVDAGRMPCPQMSWIQDSFHSSCRTVLAVSLWTG